MNKYKLLFFAAALFAVLTADSLAQSEPVLYFCSKFESGVGESGIGSKFSTGPLIVVVRCDNQLGISKAVIQLDKFDGKEFVYYNAVTFNLKPKVQYTWFEHQSLRADEPGIYRAFLLDENKNTLASALVEIVN